MSGRGLARRLARYLAALALVGIGLAGALFVWLSFTKVSAADLPPLRNGDIVFQYSGSSQSLPILLASRSAYTHMGIIEAVETGKPMVVEASSPVKETPLDQWIARGTGGWITVKRVSDLSASQAQNIIKEADRYLGLPYDIYFLDGKDAIYCSELVRLAFLDGAGIGLGMVQKVRDLDLDYAPIRKLVEARWRKHPLCRNGQKASFDACYQTVLDRTLVTPASIARDPKLETIFTNFGAVAE